MFEQDVDYYQIASLQPHTRPCSLKWDANITDPTIRFSNNCQTLQRTSITKVSEDWFKTTPIPPAVDKNEHHPKIRWRVTARRKDSLLEWPYESVSAGLANTATLGKEYYSIVMIYFSDGQIGTDPYPEDFVQWSDPVCRVAEFCWSEREGVLTVTAEGKSKSVKPPEPATTSSASTGGTATGSEGTVGSWVPVVRPFNDIGVEFTIEGLPSV
eukprot:TRINITY_DN68182_c9_g2_i1.p1 TRINITY_DN68182_c9_g2~~TRINITY_DN68182_c9_g2_i1.p1  ORF type:complete len:213 (+),score=3.07 TRINITY_DN68182_c9_g2_i1:3-641(+)